MSRGVIFYCSQHHYNTEKLVKQIVQKCNDIETVCLLSDELEDFDLSAYEVIGFASGVYMGKPHPNVLNFVEFHKNELHGKKVFTILTSGSKQKNYDRFFRSFLEERDVKVLGNYQCKGLDTYGVWKYIGGIAKKHPDSVDVSKAVSFVRQIQENVI